MDPLGNRGDYGEALVASTVKKERRSCGTVEGAVMRHCMIGGAGAFGELYTQDEWASFEPGEPLQVRLGSKSTEVVEHLLKYHFVPNPGDRYLLKVPATARELEENFEPQVQPGSSPGPLHRALGAQSNREAVAQTAFPDCIDKLCTAMWQSYCTINSHHSGRGTLGLVWALGFRV